MRIQRENCVLLAIDIQSRLFPHIDKNELVEKNSSRLIEGMKVLNVPIIVTEQYTKGLGETIDSVKNALGTEYQPLEKMTFSCCHDHGIQGRLNEIKKPYVIVIGIESHVCVLQTVIDLVENGFKPLVVADCVSSRNPIDKKFALKRMSLEGAILTTYESILFELTQKSGTDEFKAISKIVK